MSSVLRDIRVFASCSQEVCTSGRGAQPLEGHLHSAAAHRQQLEERGHAGTHGVLAAWRRCVCCGRSLTCVCVQVLKGHDDHVITCLQFSGELIVSGSDDNTLKVWSSVTGKVRECVFVGVCVSWMIKV